MVVRQNWFDVLISKIPSSSLFIPGEHVDSELFIHTLTVKHKWFQLLSQWKFIMISPLCVQRGKLRHSFPFVRHIHPHPSIYLSLCNGWNLTFPTEATRVAPQPVCHYRWPVAHYYLPLISWPPWEAANRTYHSKEGGSKARGWGELGDRKNGKSREKGEWKGEEAKGRTGRK